jgi:hypothetical protein
MNQTGLVHPSAAADPPLRSRLRHLNLAVVVAVVAVGVVQMPLDQVIDVVAVRHRLVAAARPVLVLLVVPAAVVARRAGRRVGRADFQAVLLDGAGGHVVQVATVRSRPPVCSATRSKITS